MPIILDGTKGETFPSWTTGTRPATPNAGQTGYNTTLATLERYNGTTWGPVVTTADSGTVSQTMLASNVVSNGPAFRAYVNGAQTVGNSSFTKMTLNAETFDTSNSFDSTTNYRFNVPVAGYYLVTGQCAFTGSASGYVQLYISSSGGQIAYGNCAPNNTSVGGQVVVSNIFLCAVNDYIDLWCWQNSGGNLNTQNSNDKNFLSGVLVRAV